MRTKGHDHGYARRLDNKRASIVALAGGDSGRLPDRGVCSRPDCGRSRFRRSRDRWGRHRGRNHRSGTVVRFAAVGLVALDPGDVCGNGPGPRCRGGSGRLWDRPRRRSPHRCCDRCWGRGGAGARARTTPDPGCVLVGGCQPGWLGLGWLVTSYVITTNVDERFTNFGAGGALVYGLLTWLLLAVLFRAAAPEAHGTATR